MSGYPYDDDVLEEVARRLYEAMPAMYRIPDEPPTGRGELKSLLEVLAAPLAVLRQSIHELHADLFIDTADDRIIPYLAEMVGTDLVFPDAASNRRDVRGTVGWRRRKGTPAALEEMGGELTGQPVVLQEGWKRIQLTQDLDLVRLERVVPDLRPGIVAEQATGPLDALFHTVDIRPISTTTGRRHPRHVAHWLHPTVTFPLAEATAADRSVPDFDVRYAIDPLGVRRPLRARRLAGDREPFVDRIQEQHFAATPGRWFGAEGGFTVRVCGLPAAIAATEAADRVPSVQVARRQLARGDVTLTALDLPARGWRGAIRIELGLATTTDVGEASWRPDPGSFVVRASVDLDASGVIGSTTTGGAGPAGPRVPMLRLSALGAVAGRFFPGATIEVASAAPGATAAIEDSELAREGFLRGVLHVAVPPLEIRGERLLQIAADGSLYEASDAAGDPLDMPKADDDLQLAATALVASGPGPAWPPLPSQAEPRMLNRVPGAPGRGPAVMHGARPLRRTPAGGLAQISPTSSCALAFAVQIDDPGGPAFRPFQRLAWTGRDPQQGVWTALDADGAAVGPDEVAAEFAEVAALREADPDRLALAVRFECSTGRATLCPGEISWSSDDGQTILIHLPQLDAEELPPEPPWPIEAPYTFASEPVRVGEDGSTWASESTAGRRAALGSIAPIAEADGLRRRRVRWRRLCAWDREDWSASPPDTLAPTAPGRLDVDVLHGLFGLSADEPPQSWPPDGDGVAPPSVTVDYEEGATMHLGARPAAREPVLDMRLPRPTRLVSRSGKLHPDAPADWHSIPRYASLGDALAAISARWQGLLPADAGEVSEVVQFEDSATYPDEAPVWPAEPADEAARAVVRLSLTIQAAERERPIVLVDAAQGWTRPAPEPEYASLTLRGIALGGQSWSGMTLPAAEQVAIELCTLLSPENGLEFADLETGTEVTLTRCETGALELAGSGVLTVADSIVDAEPAVAVSAEAGDVELDRVSVAGEVRARSLNASEVIFDGRVAVEDRFRGCVRYSRVTTNSTLPRVYRVAWDTPVRVVSRNRRDAAWWRLREDCDAAIRRGAENGSELGAFSLTQLAERTTGFVRRLDQFTPVGLVTGVIRID
jgi:hypothetical protein